MSWTRVTTNNLIIIMDVGADRDEMILKIGIHSPPCGPADKGRVGRANSGPGRWTGQAYRTDAKAVETWAKVSVHARDITGLAYKGLTVGEIGGVKAVLKKVRENLNGI